MRQNTPPLSDGDNQKDDQFIYALLTSRTKEEAARKSSISHAMMHRAGFSTEYWRMTWGF